MEKVQNKFKVAFSFMTPSGVREIKEEIVRDRTTQDAVIRVFSFYSSVADFCIEGVWVNHNDQWEITEAWDKELIANLTALIDLLWEAKRLPVAGGADEVWNAAIHLLNKGWERPVRCDNCECGDACSIREAGGFGDDGYCSRGELKTAPRQALHFAAKYSK